MDLEITIRHHQPQGYCRRIKTSRVYLRSLSREASREVSQAKRDDEAQAWQAADALLAFVSFTQGIPLEELSVELGEWQRISRRR